MINKLKKCFLAVLALLCIGMGGKQALSTKIPVLTRTYSDGEVIRAGDITEKTVMKSSMDGSVATSAKDLVGKVTNEEILVGAPVFTWLLEETTSAGLLGEEVAIIPITIDESKIPAHLAIGDFVSVVAYFPTHEVDLDPAFNVTFKHQARVEAIKKDINGVIVGVDISISSKVSSEVAMANSQGAISLAKVSDTTIVTNEGVTAKSLKEKYFGANIEDSQGGFEIPETPDENANTDGDESPVVE